MAVVAIVTSAPPLTEGGHLVLARSLETALLEAGHSVGIITTPSNRFGRQGPAYLANWLTDVGMTGTGQKVDQVISLRFPAYAVRHSNHVCWLVHTMRENYDGWDRFASTLSPQGRLKETTRRSLIRAADTYFLKRVKRLYTISQVVSDRLTKWNHLASEALHPPPPPRAYRCEGYGDFVFFASRLSPLNRADLLLRALAEAPAQRVRAVIGGEGEELPRLQTLVRELHLTDRVTFTGRLSDDALVEQLARCRAVVFVPKMEDYGFVTVEAFASAKPVITVSDAGGPLEFVRDRENGRIVAPDAASLAAAIAEAMDDPVAAQRWGERGRADVAQLSWAKVAARLVP